MTVDNGVGYMIYPTFDNRIVGFEKQLILGNQFGMRQSGFPKHSIV